MGKKAEKVHLKQEELQPDNAYETQPLEGTPKEIYLKQIEGMQAYDPKKLQQNFSSAVPKLLSRPVDRKRHKGTNIPKFLLKLFFNNIPEFPDERHVERLMAFLRRPDKSKTRFHLVELFGTGEDERTSRENELNRRVLKRMLNCNYDNILTNKHIRSKRLYLLFCKKMLLRLDRPELIDRLEI